MAGKQITEQRRNLSARDAPVGRFGAPIRQGDRNRDAVLAVIAERMRRKDRRERTHG
jgi:hypothetical protein